MESGNAPNSAQSQNSKYKGKPNDGTIFSLPNMGTKTTNNMTQPTAPCAKNLDELHNEYKQYKLLRKKDEMNSKCDAGTSAYLVSCSWLQNYEKFLMYE